MLSTVPMVDGNLLGSGESNKGRGSGSLPVRFVCRHTLPFLAGTACHNDIDWNLISLEQVYERPAALPELPEVLFLVLFSLLDAFVYNRRLALLERADKRAPDSVALACGFATLLRQFHPCYAEARQSAPPTQTLPHIIMSVTWGFSYLKGACPVGNTIRPVMKLFGFGAGNAYHGVHRECLKTAVNCWGIKHERPRL